MVVNYRKDWRFMKLGVSLPFPVLHNACATKEQPILLSLI